jgi:hypothetical protein
MQKSFILYLFLTLLGGFSQILSYPVSYRRLVRPDGRCVDLIGDFHKSLTTPTKSEAALVDRINELAEEKPLTVIWEYNEHATRVRSSNAALLALDNQEPGTIFLQDGPDQLSNKIDFRAADCRPYELNVLLGMHNARITAQREAKSKNHEEALFRQQCQILGVTHPRECKPALKAFFNSVEVVEKKVEALQENVAAADYQHLRKAVENLKVKRDLAQREFNEKSEQFFSLFSQGGYSETNKKSAEGLLNFFGFDVFDMNVLAEIFSTKNQVVVYAGLWHCNALEQALIKHGFSKQKDILGENNNSDYCKRTRHESPVSEATIYALSQKTWTSL